MEKIGEPPSTNHSTSALFMIGKDSKNNWVVRDKSGRHGGLFADRAAALKFAMFENGGRPRAVVMVPGIFELAMSTKPQPASQSTANAEMPLQRVANANSARGQTSFPVRHLFNVFMRWLVAHDPLRSYARG
jgi:hypothetical protein